MKNTARTFWRIFFRASVCLTAVILMCLCACAVFSERGERPERPCLVDVRHAETQKRCMHFTSADYVHGTQASCLGGDFFEPMHDAHFSCRAARFALSVTMLSDFPSSSENKYDSLSDYPLSDNGGFQLFCRE